MKKLVIVCFLFITAVTVGQTTNFSKATLEKFSKAYTEIRAENDNMQFNLMSEIEKAGLTNEQFTTIHKNLNDEAKRSQVSAEDKNKYETALNYINKFEQSTQKTFENIIKQNGLTLETYQAISKACAADKALNKQVMDMIK